MNRCKTCRLFMTQSLLVSSVFLMSYIPTYLFVGTTYSVFTTIPADQSRPFSWMYYGFFFCLIPYFLVGLMMNGVFRRVTWTAFLHSFIVTSIMDKLVLVFLATLLAKGFPRSWYGWDFPRAGYNLMCEELPFYCANYVHYYLIANTVLGLLFMYAGFLVCKAIKLRTNHVL